MASQRLPERSSWRKANQPEVNPNDSLELGFMVSRAKRILILKDSFLAMLPTDLMGKLYKEFNLDKVNRELPPIIRRWTDELLTAEGSNLETKSLFEGANGQF